MRTPKRLPSQIKARLMALTAIILLAVSGMSTAEDVIKVGISTSFKPFNYIDSSGEIRGFNADVVRAICEKMQAKCEFVALTFPKIIPALERNDIQIAASNFLKTPERLKRINFTDKYYRSTTSLIGPSEDSFKDPAILLKQSNLRILVTHESAQWHYLKRHSQAEIISYDALMEAMTSLQQGKGDYLLMPTLFALNYLQQPENSHLDFIGLPIDDVSLEGDVHMGLTKARPELQSQVNQAIRQLVDSGELRALIDKYFPFNVY